MENDFNCTWMLLLVILTIKFKVNAEIRHIQDERKGSMDSEIFIPRIEIRRTHKSQGITGFYNYERNNNYNERVLEPFYYQNVSKWFLKNFRNPCWLDIEDRLQCLPYFYFVGEYLNKLCAMHTYMFSGIYLPPPSV